MRGLIAGMQDSAGKLGTAIDASVPGSCS